MNPDIQLLLEGDPDGNPARIIPTAAFSIDRQRLATGLECARALRRGLISVLSDLDKNITELQAKTAKVSVPGSSFAIGER